MKTLYVGSHGGIGSTASTKLVDDADLIIGGRIIIF